jgi:hypothetical protein
VENIIWTDGVKKIITQMQEGKEHPTHNKTKEG